MFALLISLYQYLEIVQHNNTNTLCYDGLFTYFGTVTPAVRKIL
jgi:hypothetical protein